MQQPPQMIPMMSSFPPTNITTEQIQKYLDENKKLIVAILDNQNLGKLAECAQYQTQLQKNLMYLAAIADAQPQGPVMPPTQMAPHPAMQQGGFYMQHPQAASMAQQAGIFPAKAPLQFNHPHQMQEKQQQQLQMQQQQQQAFQAQMLGGGSSSAPPSASARSDVRAGSEQDAPDAGTTGTDGRSSSTAGPGGGDGE